MRKATLPEWSPVEEFPKPELTEEQVKTLVQKIKDA